MKPELNTNVNSGEIRARELLAYQDRSRAQRSEHGAANQALVVPPEYVSVSGTIELLKLMLENSKVDKAAKKELQRSSEAAQTAAEKAQVSELREKAESMFASSMIGALGGMASGFATAGGASLQLAGASEKVSKVFEGMGKGAEHAGGLVAGQFKRQADLEAAQVAELEARGNALRRSADSLRSDLDDVKQHDRKLLDFVREVESSMNRCTQIAMQSR